MNWLQRIEASYTPISPFVSVEVEGITNHGMLIEKGKNTCLLFIHGTASNFYENDWIFSLATSGVSLLSCNNRGSTALSSYPPHGATLEQFSWCVDDIQKWIELIVDRGYQNIILVGHSLGSEKIVHYISGSCDKHVKGVILLSFSDTFGTTKEYLGENFDKVMDEAHSLASKGKGDEFVTSDWLAHAGVLPASASNFIDFFEEGSQLSKALPFRERRLAKYSQIKMPILAVIGDSEEYTVIPLNDAISLMKENDRATVKQITNCNHDFDGKHNELSRIIKEFIVGTDFADVV